MMIYYDNSVFLCSHNIMKPLLVILVVVAMIIWVYMNTRATEQFSNGAYIQLDANRPVYYDPLYAYMVNPYLYFWNMPTRIPSYIPYYYLL